MTRIERKARQVVRESYNEYMELLHFGYVGEDMQFALRTYQAQMDLLKALFPKTTNQDNLERLWDGKFYAELKRNR